MTTNITPELARKLLWQKANLTFKLDKNQVVLKDLYEKTGEKICVWNCSRQLGKSYTLCVIAIETCLKHANKIVKFLAPTQKAVKVIIKPIMRQLLMDCPEDIRPEYKSADGIYLFKNGSEIHVAGADAGRAENIRGSKSDLVLVDECGFIKDLDYIVKSILIPTTTMTKGKIVLASTPPKSPSHPFVTFYNNARFNNAAIHRTVYDNPRLTKEDIDMFAKTVGGYHTIDFKREYLAHIIKDDNYAIVPEYNDEKEAEIVKDWHKPSYFDGYVGMDIALKDLTVVLFGYYDFKYDKLIIEDEFCYNGQQFTTKRLAEGIREKERAVFTDALTGEQRQPYIRVSDNNLIVINDLYQTHGLRFVPTRKDDADMALNELRMKIDNNKIIINPRCKTLIRHLKEGVWNKSKTSYERSSINFHYDAIDALKYMVRNVQFGRNPNPKGYNMAKGDGIFSYKSSDGSINANFKKIMNIKK